MARVLVLGASGLVGQALLRRLGDNGVGTFASRPFPGGIRFDALVDRLEDVVALDGCTHAAVLFGEVDPGRCAADPIASNRLNVAAVEAVLATLDAAGVVPVFTSSEVVFDGTKGSYVETDSPNPLFLYARQKLAVEELLRHAGRDHVVARLGRVYASEPFDGTLFTGTLERVRANRPIRCAVDQVFSPIHVDEAADALALLVEQGHRGTFHVAGPRALSRREALDLVLQEYRRHGETFDAEVEEVRVRDLPTSEPRPQDVSLDIRKLVAATGIRLRDPRAWCAEIVEAALAAVGSGK